MQSDESIRNLLIYSIYKERMLMKGNAIAQLKPVTVIGNELQKKFFLNLVDDFEEIKALSAHRYCICKIQGRLQIFVIVLLCGLSILFSGVGDRVVFRRFQQIRLNYACPFHALRAFNILSVFLSADFSFFAVSIKNSWILSML